MWFERCIQVHIMHRWNIIYFALVLNWKQQFWENLKTEFFSSFSSQKNFKKLFSSKLLLSLLLCLITVRVVWWGRLDNVISSKKSLQIFAKRWMINTESEIQMKSVIIWRLNNVISVKKRIQFFAKFRCYLSHSGVTYLFIWNVKYIFKFICFKV